jgi:hypothetical protein
MRSGIASSKPKDVPFYQALNDPDTRAEYIRRMWSLSLGLLTSDSLSRLTNTAMVDRGICYCYHSVDEEDAIWDALLGSGDTLLPASE